MDSVKVSKLPTVPKKVLWVRAGRQYKGFKTNSTNGHGWVHVVESRDSINPGAIWLVKETDLADRLNSASAVERILTNSDSEVDNSDSVGVESASSVGHTDTDEGNDSGEH
jgi:hypothetical protein